MSRKPECYGITCHPPCVWKNSKRQCVQGEEWADIQREREVRRMQVPQVDLTSVRSMFPRSMETSATTKLSCLGNSLLLFKIDNLCKWQLGWIGLSVTIIFQTIFCFTKLLSIMFFYPGCSLRLWVNLHEVAIEIIIFCSSWNRDSGPTHDLLEFT